jgi:chemotaxis protein MotB
MAIEAEETAGVPEWVVTFGDMMSLLLTFFIMLVSFSEVKQEEKYQALVESIRRQFGYDSCRLSTAPGEDRPRNSALAKLATQGRAMKLNIMQGGDKVQAPVGDHSRVVIVRPGSKTAVGSVIYFDEFSAELTEQHRQALRQVAEVIGGKPQKIEIRGHTSQRPVRPRSGLPDHWSLAYQRCRATMRVLVDELGIDASRIRISVAGPNEPAHLDADAKQMTQNPRVEVYLLDEVVRDLQGTAEEQQQRFIDDQDL